MITDREFFHRWGFALEVEPVDNIEFIGEGDGATCSSITVK
jgi:hypothetical protein